MNPKYIESAKKIIKQGGDCGCLESCNECPKGVDCAPGNILPWMQDYLATHAGAPAPAFPGTLRDEFAKAALPGLLHGRSWRDMENPNYIDIIARQVWQIADAVMKERDK